MTTMTIPAAAGSVRATDAQASPAVLRKVLTASFTGNFVEWFDYASYGYFATVIAAVFFPEIAPQAALLATFAVFAISFVIRPIGGIVWGSIGDRIGRKTALSWSILIMSGATTVIALLPSYHQIGMLAPVLLLLVRMVQGFSASGEYAGATSFLAEYAPPAKRGFYTSMVPASTAAGLMAGSLMSALLFSQLETAQLHGWGWRLPFLLAFPLGLVGLYIRLKLEDTPKFRELEARHHVEATPTRELFTTYRKPIVRAFAVTCLNAVGFYLILSYMPTYLITEMGMEESASFLANSIALFAYIFLIFLMGDRQRCPVRHGARSAPGAASAQVLRAKSACCSPCAAPVRARAAGGHRSASSQAGKEAQNRHQLDAPRCSFAQRR